MFDERLAKGNDARDLDAFPTVHHLLCHSCGRPHVVHAAKGVRHAVDGAGDLEHAGDVAEPAGGASELAHIQWEHACELRRDGLVPWVFRRDLGKKPRRLEYTR